MYGQSSFDVIIKNGIASIEKSPLLLTSHVSRTDQSSLIYAIVKRYMGWLQLVGSLKLQVSIVEYSLFYRAPLQKRSIILGAS